MEFLFSTGGGGEGGRVARLPSPSQRFSPSSEFRYFIMDGGGIRVVFGRNDIAGAVYHESRKSYFEAQ